MAVYHLNLKTFGRSGGSSAVGAAAYRSGERIRDERTGRTYDHSDRQDIMHKEIMTPSRFDGSNMRWAGDRAYLWNAAESAESRRNARVAREYLVALPVELSAEQRLELVRGFSQELVDRYQFALDLSVHEPRDFPGSDPRNFHAHLLATTREATPQGLAAKTTLEMSDAQRRALGLKPAIHELLFVRERWATVTNEALRDAHVEARVDHRSLAAQGIDREPYPRIPYAALEAERRGYRSLYAEHLRAQYQARVEARMAQAAGQRAAPEQRHVHGPVHDPVTPEKPAAEKPVARDRAAAQPQNAEDIQRRAVEDWLKMRQAAKPQTPDEARRESVENWRKMRGASAETTAPGTGRSQDDDLSP